MRVAERIKRELLEKGISVYGAAKVCGIQYELLRRTLNGKRKLSAEEFVLLLDRCNIDFEKVKEWNDVSLHSIGRTLFSFFWFLC